MSTLNVTTLKHESAGVNNITLDANGRVGIGTNNPTYNLTVAGNGTSGLCAMAFVDESNSNKEWRIDQSDGALRFTESGVAERMRIDSAGRVTMPYQPAFMAHAGSQQTSSSAEKVIFGTVLLNNGGGYNNSTYRFTASVAGIYRFSASAMTWNNYHDRWQFRKNGSSVGDQIYASSVSGSYSRLCYEIIIQLNANDYVEVWRNVQSDGSTGTHPDYRHFSGQLIG